MINGYFLMPHPPIMIPEVGKGRESEIINTINACNEIGRRIDTLDADTIIIISPHGPVFRDAIAMYYIDNIKGNLAQFGAREVEIEYGIDKELVSKIINISSENNIPTVRLDNITSLQYGVDIDLDHGAMVPLYHIKEQKKYKLVHITYGMLSAIELLKFGKIIKESVESLNRNAVLIASGDLSHRLTKDGPYEYSPFGKEFDNRLIDILEEGDMFKLFNIDNKLIKEAGECGLRSLYIMAGSINKSRIYGELLSYEGTLGIGYGVMELVPKSGELLKELELEKEKEHIRRMKEGNVYTSLARTNLDLYFNKGRVLEKDKVRNEDLLRDKKGVFVSLKINGELRGCIGTIQPTTDSVAEEIIRNSISAALNDPRFSPLRKEELKDIDISVDLLYKPEACSFEELDPKSYGVIVSKGVKRGLLLPNLEGIDTKEQQVSIAREKGGISINDNYILERFKVERYSEVEEDE